MKTLTTVENKKVSMPSLMIENQICQEELNDLSKDISGSIQREQYLDSFFDHFFLMKKVLPDPGLMELKSSSEAITEMSKASQATRTKLDAYARSLIRWVDQVLVLTAKNSQRIATALSRVVRDEANRNKIIKSYNIKDLRVEDYRSYFQALIAINATCADAIERIQNVSDNKDVISVQNILEEINTKTTDQSNKITEFSTNLSDEAKKVSPSDGHWLSETYLQQLSGTMSEMMNACLRIKRCRATITQVLNGMSVTASAQDRKMNKMKLAALQEIVLNRLKNQLTKMSTTALSVGKKLQQMYMVTTATQTPSVKGQAPTKNEATAQASQ